MRNLHLLQKAERQGWMLGGATVGDAALYNLIASYSTIWQRTNTGPLFISKYGTKNFPSSVS